MRTGWVRYAGDWYYFLDSGAMTLGWQWIDSSLYHFDANGHMQRSQWIGDRYVGADGAWVPNA